MTQLKILKRRLLWERDPHLLRMAGILGAVIVIGVVAGISDYLSGRGLPSLDTTQWAGLALAVSAPIGLFLFWRSPASVKDTTKPKFEPVDAATEERVNRLFEAKKRRA